MLTLNDQKAGARSSRLIYFDHIIVGARGQQLALVTAVPVVVVRLGVKNLIAPLIEDNHLALDGTIAFQTTDFKGLIQWVAIWRDDAWDKAIIWRFGKEKDVLPHAVACIRTLDITNFIHQLINTRKAGCRLILKNTSCQFPENGAVLGRINDRQFKLAGQLIIQQGIDTAFGPKSQAQGIGAEAGHHIIGNNYRIPGAVAAFAVIFYPVKNIVGSFVDEFLNRSISDIVGGDFAHNLPAVNLKENEGNYQLEMAAPGLTKEDFKIFLENKQLVIEVKKETKSETEENGKVLRKEFNYSEFKRTFSFSK